VVGVGGRRWERDEHAGGGGIVGGGKGEEEAEVLSRKGSKEGKGEGVRVVE